MASELRRASTEVDVLTADHLLTHRRELHAVPELSFKEFETSRYLVERLDALSPDRLEAGVAGTGVVADVKGARPGRAGRAGGVALGVGAESGEGRFGAGAGAWGGGGDICPLRGGGWGGQGAQPRFAVDAVRTAARVVGPPKTLAGRETPPAAPIVI